MNQKITAKETLACLAKMVASEQLVLKPMILK